MKHLDKEIMEENELIEQSQHNNTKATEELYNRYKTFIRSVARKYFLVDGDLDDLVQEGTFAFLRALNSFDVSKNISFKAYLSVVLNRTLINKIKASNRQKNSPLNDGYSLNAQGEVEFGDDIVPLGNDSLTPEENTISDENLKRIFDEIELNLSKYEKEILALYLDGQTYRDIASTLGKNAKSVDNALIRIKHKLQNLKEE